MTLEYSDIATCIFSTLAMNETVCNTRKTSTPAALDQYNLSDVANRTTKRLRLVYISTTIRPAEMRHLVALAESANGDVLSAQLQGEAKRRRPRQPCEITFQVTLMYCRGRIEIVPDVCSR